MKLLSIADPEIWMLAGVSVLVVFAILLILVGVLLVFSRVAKKATSNKGKIDAFVEKRQDVATDNSDLNQAAVAMALSLYLTEKEERESHVLTITPTPDSAWGARLNPRY